MPSIFSRLSVIVAIAPALLTVSCRLVPESQTWERASDAPASLITGPYLVRKDPSTMLVAMRLGKSKSEPIVEWWRSDAGPETLVPVTASPKDDLYVAALTGLPAGADLEYRVRVDSQTSQSYRFRTDAKQGEPFRFVVYGDTRTRHGVHAAVIDQAVSEDVDFVIHTGDMVQRGGVRELWDLFFQIERPLLAKAPIFPSIGNHDYGHRQYFERYFLLDETAGSRRYYYADWGNLRLVAVDGGIEGRSGSQQYAFAAGALAEAAERGMLSIMYLHWPPYSSGEHGSQLDVREPIAALAREYGVELVVTGHDHMYERTIPLEGTTYLVSGSAGAPTRNFTPSWFTANARTEPHYVLVDVESGKMTLRAVNLTGNVFDSTVIPDNPPRPTTTRQ